MKAALALSVIRTAYRRRAAATREGRYNRDMAKPSIELDQVGVDHRVMQISCLALIERTMGKAREQEDPPKLQDKLKAMSDEELAEHAIALFVAGGMSERVARAWVQRQLRGALPAPEGEPEVVPPSD